MKMPIRSAAGPAARADAAGRRSSRTTSPTKSSCRATSGRSRTSCRCCCAFRCSPIAEANLPKDGTGYLAMPYVDAALREAANQISNGIVFLEGDERLTRYEMANARISLPSDRSFDTYDGALARVRGAKLPDATQVYYNQGFLDLELHFPIRSRGLAVFDARAVRARPRQPDGHLHQLHPSRRRRPRVPDSRRHAARAPRSASAPGGLGVSDGRLLPLSRRPRPSAVRHRRWRCRSGARAISSSRSPRSPSRIRSRSAWRPSGSRRSTPGSRRRSARSSRCRSCMWRSRTASAPLRLRSGQAS